LFDQPCLIRVCSTGYEYWVSDPARSSLPSVFRPRDREHSTYRVESDIEEALAVAAHQLTNPSLKLDPRYVLRIRRSDIEESGIPVSQRHLGETGVVKVDHWHCDLIGDENTMNRLASLISARVGEGQDRVRRFTKYQLRLMIERIIGLCVEERPNHTAELCEMILNRRSQLTRDRERAIRELTSARIPNSAIRPVAFQCHEERGSSAGSSTDDWFNALDQLRNGYATHYLETHFVRG